MNFGVLFSKIKWHDCDERARAGEIESNPFSCFQASEIDDFDKWKWMFLMLIYYSDIFAGNHMW